VVKGWTKRLMNTWCVKSAKKDKKEAMKTLAEYGLAKEKIGVQREQVDATRAATSESVAMRREQAAEALQQKYFAAYKDAYKNVPEFLNDGKTVNPNFKTFPQFMKKHKYRLRGVQKLAWLHREEDNRLENCCVHK
jgi:hypothetical protein